MTTSLHTSHRHGHSRRILVLLSAGAALVVGLSACLPGDQPPIQPQLVQPGPLQPGPVLVPKVRPVPVVGTLTLMVGLGDSTVVSAVPPDRRIELPDVDVLLRNAVSGTQTASRKTQLDGRFHLKAPAPGTYTVCWKAANIGEGCGTRFQVNNDAVYLQTVPVRAKPGVVYGKVLTADQRPCWVTDPYFGLDVSTAVTLLNSAKKLAQPLVRANTQGEYAFTGLAVDKYFVRAACEKARGETATAFTSVPARADITFPNHAPKLTGVAAFDGPTGVTRAATGQAVRVEALATDQNKHAVEYLWRSVEGHGSLSALNIAQPQWTTGAQPGLQAVYVIARDGFGGFNFKRFTLPVGVTNIGFSGRVVDEVTSLPVAKAQIDVNGSTTTTNAQGWFSMTTSPVPSPERYVLNVTHSQYALLSRIHDKASAGDTYSLIRTQTTKHDPTQPIDVTDDGSSGPCGPTKPVEDPVKRGATVAMEFKSTEPADRQVRFFVRSDWSGFPKFRWFVAQDPGNV